MTSAPQPKVETVEPTSALEVALWYAANGVATFPCHEVEREEMDYTAKPPKLAMRQEKAPRTSNGLYGATKTRRIVNVFFGEKHPTALVGIPTGIPLGAWVLDLDRHGSEDEDGHVWLAQMEAEFGPLPKTARAATANNGTHLFFADEPALSNRTSIANGADCRATGAYVIGAGSRMADGRAYYWVDEDGVPYWPDKMPEFAKAPEWLLELVRERQKPEADEAAPGTYSYEPGDHSAYVEAAMRSEIERLAAQRSDRNPALNIAATNIGTLVGTGAVSRADAEAQLFAAAQANGIVAKRGERAARGTIKSGLEFGMKHPRRLPERATSVRKVVDITPYLRNGKAPASEKLESANDNGAAIEKTTVRLPKPDWPGLVSSGDLVRGFVPPDYHVDGIVQSSFVYSVTASTGTGKTAILLLLSALTALGKPLGDREVRQGRVVYFAGENPVDVTMRWIGAAHAMGFDPDAIAVHFVPGTFDITKMYDKVSEAVRDIGGADLIVIDTSAAYFQGTDENGNVDMGRHARNLRELTELPGAPCVLVACHPTKSADQSNLLPRGGGAFLAEMDGNLVCMRSDGGTVKLHWQGKHRGPDFKPVYFDLTSVTAPALVDSKGRDIPTVMASVVSEGETRQRRETARKDEDLVLIAIENLKSPSNAVIADYLGWKDASGEPHKRRAQTATTHLRKDKLAELTRDGWSLTTSGQTAATAAREVVSRDGFAKRIIANLTTKTDRTETERTHGYGSDN